MANTPNPQQGQNDPQRNTPQQGQRSGQQSDQEE